ncbi:LysR substrate-binding domain-containing protein [Brenneria populi]|uniref:LysR substrate-binding domain-containing protein n=1 Tax=Brenneria populi TaxID=1505588 RepID=A0ABU6JT56_9GAMM|nr:LysR substrate-binding domain-containing protein [Brenneria populi Li et al. 2015]
MIYAQLRAFLAAAHSNSFSEGARLLNITQPSISKQIRDLEKRCGEPLFERIGRSVRLTPLGLRVMEISKRMMDAELDCLLLFNDVAALEAGVLRIAAVGPYHLMTILPEFHSRYPKVRINVRFGGSNHVEEAVRQFDADIGILAMAPGRAMPEMDAFPYRSCPIVLSVPADHRLARAERLSVQDLAAESIIHREPGSTTRQIFENVLYAEKTGVNSILEIGSREAIRIAVANGLGIGYVSEDEIVPHPNIRHIPLSGPTPRTNATLIWRSGRDDNTLVKAFLNVAREQAMG